MAAAVRRRHEGVAMSDVQAMVLTAPETLELQTFPKPELGEDDDQNQTDGRQVEAAAGTDGQRLNDVQRRHSQALSLSCHQNRRRS